ncbi:hypothetical protein ER308_16905 [Egibacter rhizosphaerae]|uniref:SAF domain-containing protein n=1 Tax=Egibacter rhizosphaerae TaxID=1670831 RepID=A0A411YJ36_9ACTN|nr:hypothetical protein [Egibacter rhizosphaerae]QBI21086.1 hypothetical protein ER308_16905 [Egibacter rhizosphaerae]
MDGSTSPGPLRGLLRGPLPALPRPIDAASEWWAGLPPRARPTIVVLLVLALVLAAETRVQLAQLRWGGEPVRVAVAEHDHAPGDHATVTTERRPAALAPPDAVSRVEPDARLALALPEGAVVTSTHLHAAGPAGALPGSLRAVPVPVEEDWGVTAGGWVDVWVLGRREEAATLVAQQRPVVGLDVDEERGEPTALVALAGDEVAAVTSGLAAGEVLLAHAPEP